MPPSTCSGQDAEFVWHKDTSLARRRRRGPARRVRPRRLPAHRRHRALLAGDAGGASASPPPAARCSASATASRCCSRPGCCRARCCATRGLQFRCEHVHVRVEHTDTPFTAACRAGPGAADADRARRRQLLRRARRRRARWRRNRQVLFRYVDAGGESTRRRQPERLGAQHRRPVQRGAQRRRPDAAPRARVRAGCWAAPTAW